MILAAAFQPYDPGIDNLPAWVGVIVVIGFTCAFLDVHGVLPRWANAVLSLRARGRHRGGAS